MTITVYLNFTGKCRIDMVHIPRSYKILSERKERFMERGVISTCILSIS
ncbi:hypothetical protein CLOSYM_02352 [[Clostridium] symbiosum ATCC 14940]|uniref:Uncharacterized protein n=1 Tax=[Clostridium] symbiosum ATCC 14940 TaxID=411472 RepID=A0ABC9TXM7_CLOSY|nr:hypothetical protein CLOSYM_02352 [[Clostridium] symbiosum ATCC 14940]